MKIVPYSDKYKRKTIDLITGILRDEFNFYKSDRPDLYKISEVYQKNKGNFWLAIEKNDVIGTIGLCDYGNNQGYLRRMYVTKNFRKRGIANKLFTVLIKFARDNAYREIFLGTDKCMVFANKFYIKKRFKKIKSLPKNIPEFDDPIFYKIKL